MGNIRLFLLTQTMSGTTKSLDYESKFDLSGFGAWQCNDRRFAVTWDCECQALFNAFLLISGESLHQAVWLTFLAFAYWFLGMTKFCVLVLGINPI